MKELIKKELREGATIEETCQKHKLSFKELCNMLITSKGRETPVDPEEDYIFVVGNRYGVCNIINDTNVYFGTYINLIDAISARNELVNKNWEVNPDDYLGDKFIYYRNGSYGIIKTQNNQSQHFGYYYTLPDARMVRDELIKCNWDKSQVNSICERLKVELVYGY